MRRVTDIRGIFFKAKDGAALRAWYERHLGIDVQEWGGTRFTWTDSEGKPTGGTTVWSIGPEKSEQFAPSKATFLVNYRVEDSGYGTFAWILDPEGNKNGATTQCREKSKLIVQGAGAGGPDFPGRSSA